MKERQRNRQREKQAPCRESDMGLDPRTPGSHPGPKAGAKPLSHPGILQGVNSYFIFTASVRSRFNPSPFLSWPD